MKLLSILICSLKVRAAHLALLLGRLEPQARGCAEILIEQDAGEMTIGAKRNRLLERAAGEYVCFIDDDDLVSPDYIQQIETALAERPDCVGIEGLLYLGGCNPLRFIQSLQYAGWFEINDIHYRNPNHLNPIRAAIARRVGFPAINYAEDKDYSMRLLPLLRSETCIQKPVYYYYFRTKYLMEEA